VEICDFFANAPGLGCERPEQREFPVVEVDFGPAKQPFYIGAGSAAVPGATVGLCTALERWGTLPLSRVIKPACNYLRQGLVLGPWQARPGPWLS
jgi:gamma-glutamyltranspeptidase